MKIILLGLFSCLSITLWGKENPENIIRISQLKLAGYKSLSYEAFGQKKFLTEDDTVKFSGHVSLRRDDRDSIFAGMVWVFDHQSPNYIFYDLHNIYKVNSEKRTATKYNTPSKWTLIQNNLYSIVQDDFLNKEAYNRYLDPKNGYSLLSDTIITKKECYQIKIKYPDTDELTEYFTIICYDKETYIPVYKMMSVKFQNNYQYTDLLMKSYSLNSVKEEKFSANQIPKDYTITERNVKGSPQNVKDRLDSGIHAPIMTGRNFTMGISTDTLNFLGKITILDFWYMGCYPCVKLMPHLEKLKKYYNNSSQVQVFGVNSFDNNEKSIKKLKDFLEYNKITYPTLLVSENTVRNYMVSAWPTLYIIDTDGFIHTASVGSSENFFEECVIIIDKLLQAKK